MKTNKILLWIFSLLLAILTWQLLWGKLFPLSPMALGFSKHELSHTLIYVQQGAGGLDYAKINSWIPGVEKFHELKFVNKPKIYVFRDRRAYLQRNITRARFCAYPNGSLVISPWARQEAEAGTISLEIYLKHELSHTLLYQHMGFFTIWQYPQWLMEGIAVYSAGQMGTSWYPSRAETREFMRRGNFMPPEYFKTRKEKRIALEVPYRITFMYSEFACLVDYLIEFKGKDNFLIYMKRLLKGGKHAEVFKEVFGAGYDQVVMDFKQFVMKRTK